MSPGIPRLLHRPSPHNSHIAMNRIWPTPTQISRAPDGMALISVVNSDGDQSNVLPLRVRALPRFTVPPQTGASIAAEGFRLSLTGSVNQF